MNNTIYAPATASGGAIGIIRVSGSRAIAAVNTIFSRDITNVVTGRIYYGNIISPQNEIVDDVLVTVFFAPHSYTGEDSVEISHHGSPYIRQIILQLLNNQNCRLAEAGEFTKRAFLNGKMDLAQAEGVADLIAAESAASHRIAIKQMRGGISKRLNELSNMMLELITLLELELDFSEEDVEFADRTRLVELADSIASELATLIRTFATGNAIKNGIPVAIIGAPNVGKSTLLNRLLNEDRAIVSDIQGTTRDLIEEAIQIDGITYRFIDTAGIRKTDDTIERLGIERSLKAADRAQIIILITEPGVPFIEITPRQDQTIIHIINKTTTFSALEGRGIDHLIAELSAAVPTPQSEDIIITNVRHKELLTTSHEAILRAIAAMRTSIPSDLIVEDLRQCITSLNEISGQAINSDLVLHNIFANFCIGK